MKKRFLQSDFWASFKSAHNWTQVKSHGESQETSVLVRSFKFGPVKKSIAYIPMFPEIPENVSAEDFENSLSSNPALSEINNLLCWRFDPAMDFATAEERDAFVAKIKKASKKIKKTDVDIQPPDTVLLDLVNVSDSENNIRTEDELLSAMKSKWRYNIRLAEKKGVQVRKINADSSDFEKDLDSFYEIYKTTASRDGIGLHPKSYYKDLLERGSKENSEEIKVYLYIASHKDEEKETADDLACIIVLFSSKETVYLYGCSSNVKRNLMPAYLLQWTAIKDALSYGSEYYDFYGIPPTNDENHPMHGLYLFKTGFGGREVHRPGSFDIPKSFLYTFYIAAERLRAFWHKKVMKKIRGR